MIALLQFIGALAFIPLFWWAVVIYFPEKGGPKIRKFLKNLV